MNKLLKFLFSFLCLSFPSFSLLKWVLGLTGGLGFGIRLDWSICWRVIGGLKVLKAERVAMVITQEITFFFFKPNSPLTLDSFEKNQINFWSKHFRSCSRLAIMAYHGVCLL